ncbi:hypothetical protein B0T24DRAFT_569852 [Lasiosphaeria ovina]|uniref:Uncharacterized protein n=1 Tax=Lasiosphaeria ovina TaxID=92902 RepID=A0AAE0NDU3_9PEZI|nr:hypothetical protein B0T24DRAFT_569852 [Lasiosphaeria ovina]
MNLPPSDIIPIPAGLRKRFYEPVVILCCVPRYCIRNSVETATYEVDTPKSLEHTYRCFVDKLSQICDSERGGETVTSFGVLKLDKDKVQYWFASNQRNTAELGVVEDYITDIFQTLSNSSRSDVKLAIANPRRSLYSDILTRIIRFNRGRMELYVERLCKELEICLDDIDDAYDSLDEDSSNADEDGSDDSEGDATQTQTLMYTLNDLFHGELETFVREKCIATQAKRGNQAAQISVDEPLGSPWEDAYHCIGRLLSYFLAVNILLSARKYWPELFHANVQIVRLPSSRPERDPPSIRKSADRILHSMTQAQKSAGGGGGEFKAYRRNTAALKAWGIDDRIKEVTHHLHFRPIVHAEILVDDAIRRAQRIASTNHSEEDEEEPLGFFREAEFGRYIGSSKPTCRLCALYFAAQGDGPRVRPPHGNVYHNWRAPDVFAGDGGEDEGQRRNAVLEKMVATLRADTWNAIRSKSAPWKAWDSNDTATNPLLARATAITASVVDALAVRVGGVAIAE